jgi:Holliday junction resolvase
MTPVSQGLVFPARRRRPTRAQAITGDQPEREFMREVIKHLERCGWTLIYHAYDSTNSPAGFPDIIALRGNRGLALECKSQHHHTTTERLRKQEAWIVGFNAIPGFAAAIVRPSDWPWILQVVQ